MRFESVALEEGDRSSFVRGEARLEGGKKRTRQVLEIGNLARPAKLLVRIMEPFLLWVAMILAILEPSNDEI